MDKILISMSNTEKYKILLREMKCINKEIHLAHVLEDLKLSPDSKYFRLCKLQSLYPIQLCLCSKNIAIDKMSTDVMAVKHGT